MPGFAPSLRVSVLRLRKSFIAFPIIHHCCSRTSGRSTTSAPRFPKLQSFLDFWIAKLDGKLFRVTVAHSKLIRPAELRLVGTEFKLN